MSRSLRVLELAEKLNVGTDDLIAVWNLLDIPAISRVSYLKTQHAKKLINCYKQEQKHDINNG